MEAAALEWTEWIVHKLFFWETDNKRKVQIARALHHFASYALITLIFVSQLIYPRFWLQTIVVFFCGLTWIQHILANGCIISKVEQKLIGDTTSFIDPYLTLFNIEVASEQSKIGILILGSTIAAGLLSMQWAGRFYHEILPTMLGEWMKVRPSVSVSVQSIPPLLSSP
jgi:hypothetical protein